MRYYFIFNNVIILQLNKKLKNYINNYHQDKVYYNKSYSKSKSLDQEIY